MKIIVKNFVHQIKDWHFDLKRGYILLFFTSHLKFFHIYNFPLLNKPWMSAQSSTESKLDSILNIEFLIFFPPLKVVQHQLSSYCD